MNIDEAIQIAKSEVEKMHLEGYKGMSRVQVETTYQRFIDLLWMKINILIAKQEKDGKKERNS